MDARFQTYVYEECSESSSDVMVTERVTYVDYVELGCRAYFAGLRAGRYVCACVCVCVWIVVKNGGFKAIEFSR